MNPFVLTIYCFILAQLYLSSTYAKSSLSDNFNLLVAAEKGEIDKVIDFIINKGISITTKNNYGVR